jgi:5-methylcytosine-specific restriction endonuclease McrA
MSKYQELISMPELEIVTLIERLVTTSAVLRALHWGQDMRARKYLNGIAKKHNLPRRQFNAKKGYSIESVRSAVAAAMCVSDVLRSLGLQTAGGNDNTIKRIIAKNNIDISHFDSKKAATRTKIKWTPNTVFVENSKIHRSTLSTYVRKFSALPYECTVCHNSGTWLGRPLPLSVDHVNGISNDNRIENLRYLCPNCHNQTDTFGGKNKC